MMVNRCLFAAGVASLLYLGMGPSACGGKVNVNPPITSATGGAGGTGAGGTGGVGGTGGPGGTGGTGGTGGVGGTGAGGTGGSTAAGGMMNTGADLCPGDPFDLPVDGTLMLQGDTTMANGDYSDFCGNTTPGSGNDLVYAVNLQGAATVTYTLSAPGTLDPVMYVRTTCDDSGTTSWCRDFSASTRINKRHVDAGTHFVFVDGNAGTSGEYTLTIAAAAPTCGDGIINTGEACDDGNTMGGDGCAGDCLMVEAGANDDCTDPSGIFINPNLQIVMSGSTVGNTHQHTFDEANCTIGGQVASPLTDNGAPDKVFRLVPTSDGTLNLTLGFDQTGADAICETNGFNDPGCWDRVLHVRHTQGSLGPAICGGGEDISDPSFVNWVPPTNQIACDAFGVDPGYTQAVSFAVQNGESYYVFVSGYYIDATMKFDRGSFNLIANLAP